MDKYHGQGGSYEVDPLTRERKLKGEPTKATDAGGPRDKDGKPIVEKRAEKPEPAMPLAPEKAPWDTEAPASAEPQPKKKGA